MARHNKSDDSGDSDFDPHVKKSSSVKKKKVGATEVKKATSLQLNKAPYNHNTSSFGGPLPTPGLTHVTGSSGAFSQYPSSHRDSVVSTQYVVEPPVLHPQQKVQVPLQSPFAIAQRHQSQLPLQLQSQAPSTIALPPTPQTSAVPPTTMLQFEDEVLDGQLHFSRRGKFGHCSRDTADLW